MDPSELIQDIAVSNVDVDKFVQLAIDEKPVRDEIIQQLITNPNIMVYYHCYYVVSKASWEKPELFYEYWFEIASLLEHKNSYHRDFALTILANLTQVDQRDLFPTIYHDYFEHINDQKFMTGQCCIRNSVKIIKNKPGLRDQIVTLLLAVDQKCSYPEKQKELMKADILEVFEGVYEGVSDQMGINEFILESRFSASPKTRRKAKELVRKYEL